MASEQFFGMAGFHMTIVEQFLGRATFREGDIIVSLLLGCLDVLREAHLVSLN